MIRFLMVLALLLGAVPAHAADSDRARTAIEAALRDSAAGWNAGDLERFMAVYSESAETSFVVKDGLIRRKTVIAGRYEPGFAPERRNAHGVLSFKIVDFRMLGRRDALVIARYLLAPSVAGQAERSGMTSLIFRRENGKWRIIADHSS